MKVKQLYLDLSIKYKILILFYSLILVVASILGVYSYLTSERFIVGKVSSANLEVIQQMGSSIQFLQKDIDDISTYLCLDQGIQTMLSRASTGKDYQNTEGMSESDTFTITNALNFIMNIVASKSYISMIAVYGENGVPPYFISTDGSIVNNHFQAIRESMPYRKAQSLRGSPYWFYLPAESPVFLQENPHPKVVMCRVINNIYGDYSDIGFLTVGINESTLRALYPDSLQMDREGIMIVDDQGNIISHEGIDFYSHSSPEQPYLQEASVNTQGYLIDTVLGRKMLVTYTRIAETGWKIFYMVPMSNLTSETNSIKTFTSVVILVCLVFSFPLAFLISSLLTAPIQQLLQSMKKFQKGNFNEKVNFKYQDEIGQLGEGYNNMVANIRELIDNAYILQIKEREAELNALQAQINPHFLYNTLDTIFWKAEDRGETEISRMVYSLSKMFRLSLNRGKGSTVVAREKELLEHYLLLQKGRFHDKLRYDIQIDEGMLNCVIPKLILQPFVENAILHGIEKKATGGTIAVHGTRMGCSLCFTIEDDGVGMDENIVKQLLTPVEAEDATISSTSGGYAVRNVNERLKIHYSDRYKLEFLSSVGSGTKVTLVIPAVEFPEDGDENHGKAVDH